MEKGKISFSDMVLWEGAKAPYLELTVPLSVQDNRVEQLKLRLPCYDSDEECNSSSDVWGIGAELAWVEEVFKVITPLKPNQALFSRKTNDGKLVWRRADIKCEDGLTRSKTTIELLCSRFIVANIDELAELARTTGVKQDDFTSEDVTYSTTVLALRRDNPFTVVLDCSHTTPDSWGKRPKKA